MRKTRLISFWVREIQNETRSESALCQSIDWQAPTYHMGGAIAPPEVGWNG